MSASFDPSEQDNQQREVLMGAGGHDDDDDEYHGHSLRVVGDLITRRVQYLKCNRPQTMEYPSDAIVLNPKHTSMEQRRRQLADADNGIDASSIGSPTALTAHAPVFARKRHAEDCEDDPRYKELPEIVCTEAQLYKMLKLNWTSVGAGCGAGLVNCGNTCFANAVLQCLAFTPPVAQFFMQYVTNNSGLGGSAGFAGNTTSSAGYDYSFALAEVIRSIHASKGKAIRPSPIIANLSGINKTFRIGKQSDAHEFLQCLFGKCHQSLLNKHTKGRKLIMLVANTGHLMRVVGGYFRSQVSWSKGEEINRLKQSNNAAAANDLQMNKSLGKADLMVSNTYEIFTVINLQLVHEAGPFASRHGGGGGGGKDGSLSVQQCLDDYFAKEQLDGRIYMTPRKVQVKAWKQFTLHIPPPTLTLHMKRFSNTGTKIGKAVRFSTVLDMRKYCSPNSDVGEAVYDLCAVAVHEGRSVESGHYYAYVRGRNKLWYCCDDSTVRQVGEQEVLRCQAYMLFYNMQDNTLRSRIERITPPTTPTAPTSVTSGFPEVSPRAIPKTVRAEVAPAADEGKEVSEADLDRILKENQRNNRALQLASAKEMAKRIELDTETDTDGDGSAEENGDAEVEEEESLHSDALGSMSGSTDDEEAEDAANMRAFLERRKSRSASETGRSPGSGPATGLPPPSPLSRPTKSPSASPSSLKPSTAAALAPIPSIFMTAMKGTASAPAASTPADQPKLTKKEKRERAQKLFESQMEIELPTAEEKAGVRKVVEEVVVAPTPKVVAKPAANSALPKMSNRYAGIVRTVKNFKGDEEDEEETAPVAATRLSGTKMPRSRGDSDEEEEDERPARITSKAAKVMPFNKDALRRAQHTGSMEPTATGVAHRTILRDRSEGTFSAKQRDEEWDNDFDKGRVKKLRRKGDDERFTRPNPFQLASNDLVKTGGKRISFENQ